MRGEREGERVNEIGIDMERDCVCGCVCGGGRGRVGNAEFMTSRHGTL